VLRPLKTILPGILIEEEYAKIHIFWVGKDRISNEITPHGLVKRSGRDFSALCRKTIKPVASVIK
jgi:hypothetical protein